MIARMLILALALIAIIPAANAENDRKVDYGRACEAYNQGAYFTAFHDLMPFAVRGDAQAQFAVGEMLRTGSGTQRNREEALIWTRRAAEQGHAAAQCNLGISLFRGIDKPRDVQAAIDWWLRAAVNKNAHAMFNLGSVLARGRYVKQDLVRAYWWMTEASSHGYAGAEDVLTTFRKIMTTAQIVNAQKLTQDDAIAFDRQKPRLTKPERRNRP